ncbi:MULTISPECIES: hypothetical protein [Providencia]|uniref:hypothetical protein n=1 Tax=Providencia TaxID=586 RepID=UPI0018C5DE72|nr:MULTISPECIES: hypothetical protein [Providencia]MBG5927653.1 hypothetical protein [Providencia rettgeri]WIE07925.1 hypothetical protein N4838_018990 [Providencia rettgeri]
MKIAIFLPRQLLGASMIRRGNFSNFSSELLKISGHALVHPTPQKSIQIENDLNQQKYLKLGNNQKELEKTAEYKQLVDNSRRKKRHNAYSLNQSYAANGGIFSYAQQLANKSGCNIIGVKGEYVPALEGNKLQYIMFRPQNKLLGIISHLGNVLLSQRC